MMSYILDKFLPMTNDCVEMFWLFEVVTTGTRQCAFLGQCNVFYGHACFFIRFNGAICFKNFHTVLSIALSHHLAFDINIFVDNYCSSDRTIYACEFVHRVLTMYLSEKFVFLQLKFMSLYFYFITL